MTEHRIFELGDFALQKGSVLPNARHRLPHARRVERSA